MDRLVVVLRRLGDAGLALATLSIGGATVLAIRYSPLALPWRFAAGTALVAALLVAFARWPRRATVVGWLMACGATLAWWRTIPASNDRDWLPELARTARAEFAGDVVTIRNVRDFDYRTDAPPIERWIDLTRDLRQLEGVDLAVSNWGLARVSHTMMSFRFEDGCNVVLSIETRLERGEPQEALRALFRQYELIYVLATERDAFRVRTDFREPREQLRVYPTTLTAAAGRQLLATVLRHADGLAMRPRYYNLLQENCTTGALPIMRAAGAARRFDFRLLCNARVDELAQERGLLDASLPLAELRERHRVASVGAAPVGMVEYSRAIRGGR